ncbi:N-acetylneuraminate synthase family protein [Candidatus Magnetominusculus dajiuhuensis]|uniref:N-acetylneuraminate synthase family protein n=1 Tax=Candidatus Magnetominusculus dajiuhuensis TaxID=3137712 RepID=UPI003B43A3A4
MKIRELFDTYNQFDASLSRPYIIAEAGVNHEGSMDLAKRLIDDAKEGGANAIKFQTYRAHTIASKHSPAYWDMAKEPTSSQYELFKKYDKFWKKECEELKRYCDRSDIGFMSTPFDVDAADFLNDLMDVFKISSSDITNKPFIDYICRFNKPVILSVGASYIYEVEEAISWIEEHGNSMALLHCILSYPTMDADANLGMIIDLKKRYPGKLIGYSDHTLPRDMKTLEAAVLVGAAIIEKHFTYDKTLPGNDHYHAMDKVDLKLFNANLDRLFTLLGSFKKTSIPSEGLARLNARRSLVALRDIPIGKSIEEADITFKRPANGISPKFISEVVGKKAVADIRQDDILTWRVLCD